MGCLALLICCVPIGLIALVVGGLLLFLYFDRKKKRQAAGPPPQDDWPDDQPSGWDEADKKGPGKKG